MSTNTCNRPSSWFIKTGCIVPPEIYSQDLHNTCLGLNLTKEERVHLRNRKSDGTTYYTSSEIDRFIQEMQESSACSICMTDIVSDSVSCDFGHASHRECIMKSNCVKCPVCRAVIYNSKGTHLI